MVTEVKKCFLCGCLFPVPCISFVKYAIEHCMFIIYCIVYSFVLINPTVMFYILMNVFIKKFGNSYNCMYVYNTYLYLWTIWS